MELPELSKRCDLLNPSPTLGITAQANAMRAEGHDVLSFAAGEPDFATPAEISQAAIQALEAGFTKYTPSSGIKELKEAIASKLLRENQVSVEPGQVVVSCGAKQSIYQAMMVLLNPGDEVILIAPYWMTYREQVILAGGVPKVVHTKAEDGFLPDPEAIREAIGPKTKAIIVNSPSNPTGAVFPRSLIKEIAALALKHSLWVVADEIYERLTYGEEHQSIAALGKEIAARTLTVGGCSKSFAMTGWRIGFAAAPKAVAEKLSNLQDQITSNPTSFAQKGAVAAYNMDPAAVNAMRDEFQNRRDVIVSEIAKIPNVGLKTPMGAFYVLPDFSSYLGSRFANDEELARHLLLDAKVATIPGSVFEAPGHLRLSYATNQDVIRRGLQRIAEALLAVSV